MSENERPNVGEDAKWFDDTRIGHTKNAEMNKHFLLTVQDWCNEKLKRNGYLFLNEVYDSLGIPRTRRGQLVGWVYKHEDGTMGYVDFGLYKKHNRKFTNGHEIDALLDFNVDGSILEYLPD